MQQKIVERQYHCKATVRSLRQGSKADLFVDAGLRSGSTIVLFPDNNRKSRFESAKRNTIALHHRSSSNDSVFNKNRKSYGLTVRILHHPYLCTKTYYGQRNPSMIRCVS